MLVKHITRPALQSNTSSLSLACLRFCSREQSEKVQNLQVWNDDPQNENNAYFEYLA